jgi:hypothetical protein
LYESALGQMAALKAAAAQPVARSVTPGDAPRGARGLSVMSGGGAQRLFLAVGKRDQVRVGDIVGAIANEAGIDGDRIGAVELFESHATVELSAEDAARAVSALSAATLRGRKLSARIDERSGSDRGGDRGGDRGAPRGEKRPRTFGPPRSAPRGDRPDRGERGERSERPPMRGKPSFARGGKDDARGGARGERGGMRDGGARGPRTSFGATEARREFGDRPARERTEGTSEWSQRGERMKHAKRPPRERPEPPSEA